MLLHVRFLLGSREHRKRKDPGNDTAAAHERKRLQYSRHALYCRVHRIRTACELDLQEDWTAESECYDVLMGYRCRNSEVSSRVRKLILYHRSMRSW
jgi:hypothetical protein